MSNDETKCYLVTVDDKPHLPSIRETPQHAAICYMTRQWGPSTTLTMVDGLKTVEQIVATLKEEGEGRLKIVPGRLVLDVEQERSER